MAAALRQTTTALHQGNPDRLGIAFLIAIVLHGVLLLGIGFQMQERYESGKSIEVTLAQHRSQKAPEKADYLAQFDQMGSGTEDHREAITTDQPETLESAFFKEIEALVPIEITEEAAHQSAQRVISRHSPDSTFLDTAEVKDIEGNISIPQQVVREISSLRARLSQQQQQYSKLPRTKVMTAASAKAAEEADYMRRWIEWVETVGNQNYPEEARRKKIFGAIRLAVTLARDGSVEAVEILQTSGQRVLDQAAIRIVRLAAPFDPMPSNMTEDRLEVIRTWHFMPGDQLTSSAN